MRKYLIASTFAVAALLGVSSHLPVYFPQNAEAAQNAEASNSQTASTVHDLSGVWFQRPGSGVVSFNKEAPPMQPWVEEKSKTLRHDRDDPNLHCLPPGVPRVLLQPSPMEIIQIPGRILISIETGHLLRQIWMDRQDHPSDLNPTWMGDSIGRWDGDTLVVDTVGLTDKSWLDSLAHLHTDALHVTERYRRVDHDTLQVDVTIDDPKAYTHPWGGQRVFKLHPDWHIMENICEDTGDYEKSLAKHGQ